jgi:hypothetical protein
MMMKMTNMTDRKKAQVKTRAGANENLLTITYNNW